MSSTVISKDDQLVIIVNQKRPFRGGTWHGSLEIDRGKEYSYADIFVLADEDPESILMVLKITPYSEILNITDAVLDFAENQP